MALTLSIKANLNVIVVSGTLTLLSSAVLMCFPQNAKTPLWNRNIWVQMIYISGGVCLIEAGLFAANELAIWTRRTVTETEESDTELDPLLVTARNE